MPRLYGRSGENIFGMHNDILEKNSIGLFERGLLVTLLYNDNKDINELMDELPNDKNAIKESLHRLESNGYIKIENIGDEEILRVSDYPAFIGEI